MKIILGILVLAAVGAILAAIKRDWLALGVLVNASIYAFI
jgi:hypothetical protein